MLAKMEHPFVRVSGLGVVIGHGIGGKDILIMVRLAKGQMLE
jgi:hypothetical protein